MSTTEAVRSAAAALIVALDAAELSDDVWFDPSPAKKAAFAAAHGIDPAILDGWPGPPTPNDPGTWQKKIAPLPADATDAQILEYHGMGFTRDGHHACWTKFMKEDARASCRLIALATSPEEADSVYPGAGNLAPEISRVLFMGHGQSPSAFWGPLRSVQSIANAANYCVGTLDPSTGGVV